jgi:uncharacterized SAM-binding protein YcdF (DUF218 family)
MKNFKRVIFACIAIGLAVAGFIYANILYFSCHAVPEKSDVIIVLGCRANGETPSLSLEYRLRKALELYRDGYGGYIIVSGGQGSNESFPESYVMRKWLQSRNVPKDAVIEESLSTNTFENLKNSRRIMEDKNWRTAVIVSNDFHIFRSLFLADRLGLKASGAPAPDVAYTRLYYRTREVASVVKSFLLDK